VIPAKAPSEGGPTNPPAIPQREIWLVLILSVILALAFGLLATTEFRFEGDSEHYVGVARAIARGEGPSTWRYTVYPPGAPLVLAPAAWLFHGSFGAISRWAAILASLSFPLTWLYVRRRGQRFALSIAILTVGSAEFLMTATDAPMSDAIYLAVSLGLFLWADAQDRPKEPGFRWPPALLGCGLLVALPMVRSIGITALGAVVGVLLLRMIRFPRAEQRARLRWAIPLVGALVILLLWKGFAGAGDLNYLKYFLRADVHEPDRGLATVQQLLARPGKLFLTQVQYARQLMFPWADLDFTWFSPAWLAVLVAVTGWWKDLRGPKPFAAIYFLLYLGILLFWPYEIGPRFTIPLVPLLWSYLFAGIAALATAIVGGRRWLRVALSGWAMVALVGIAIALVSAGPRLGFEGRAGAGLWLLTLGVLGFAWKPLANAVRTSGPRIALVLVSAGTVWFLLTSVRRAAPLIVPRAQGRLPLWLPQQAMAEASRWISANTSPGAVILATYHSRIEFATGRRTVLFPITQQAEPFLEAERSFHPNYLVVVESDDTYHVPNDPQKFPVIQRLLGNRLKQVHHGWGATIYAIQPEPGTRSP
jgi:hypothetical protein